MERSQNQEYIRPVDLGAALVVSLFIIAIALAEEVVSLGGAIAGGLFHMVILLALFSTYFFVGSFPYRRILLALLLLPLLRLLSLTVPIPELPQLYWYAAIGIPMLFAASVVYHYVRVPLAWLRMQWVQPDVKKAPVQVILGLLGIPMSLIGFQILHPQPLVPRQNWLEMILAMLILVVFSAYTEELILRGLILPMLIEVYGRAGIWVCAFLTLVLYLGSYSIPYVLFNGILGLLFAVWVKRSGSIWGAVMAHSFLNIGMLLILPILLP